VKKKEFYAHDLNWINPPSLRPAKPGGKGMEERAGSFRATVKVRSTMKDEPATIFCNTASGGETVRVVFDEPQWAPAPGQGAVFYDNDVVIGGGVIHKPG
jgi:tRNA U34 2-thiouridine synthase MnmA/TrmU